VNALASIVETSVPCEVGRRIRDVGGSVAGHQAVVVVDVAESEYVPDRVRERPLGRALGWRSPVPPPLPRGGSLEPKPARPRLATTSKDCDARSRATRSGRLIFSSCGRPRRPVSTPIRVVKLQLSAPNGPPFYRTEAAVEQTVTRSFDQTRSRLVDQTRSRLVDQTRSRIVDQTRSSP